MIMKSKIANACIAIAMAFGVCPTVDAQITERERPAEWKNLVKGAKFIDRFRPMVGNEKNPKVWGTAEVQGRYTDNGIEDNIWSYWGGNIKKDANGVYHLMVCGWLEASQYGHMQWRDSYTFDATSDNLHGPYKPQYIIGKGHNPEVYTAKDGRQVLYVIGGRYVANDINGPWEFGHYNFLFRDRHLHEDLSNLSFAKREDGSILMVSRGGQMWISEDGVTDFHLISEKSVYPPVDGRFEDPVLWYDGTQYHLIVNDWLGRIAYYQRSKDGINWVTDPGEAYEPGVAVHPDGKKEEWFKYERLKIYQDEKGRPIQANFAVIDTLKYEDKPYDTHSSKNISIALNPGVELTLLNEKAVTKGTKEVRVIIHAEEGFDPAKDINIESLRFGANELVNYGKGGKVVKTTADGKDLIVTFDGRGCGITTEEFAPKLIGAYADGSMLYGYARPKYLTHIEAILSAQAPTVKDGKANVIVENFGQVASGKASVELQCRIGDKWKRIAQSKLPVMEPYTSHTAVMNASKLPAGEQEWRIVITHNGKQHSTFTTKRALIGQN